jgi:hypothetical protein
VTQARQHRKLELPAVSLGDFSTEPAIVLNAWYDEVEKGLEGRFLLVSVDEFEKLDEAVEEGKIGVGVFDVLRNLIQHRHHQVFLLAGVHMLEEMARDWHSYFIGVTPIRISYLSTAAARELITNPMDDFPLNYSQPAVKHILGVTRCQPYLLQLLCFELVNYLNGRERRSRQEPLQATVSDVREAQARALEAGQPYFVNLWSDSTTGERLLLAALARMGEPQRVLSLVREVERDSTSALRDLKRLVRRDLVEEQGGGFRFQVPLFRDWVACEKPQFIVQAEALSA